MKVATYSLKITQASNIIIIIYTLFGINAPEGANKTLSTLNCILIYLALPRISYGRASWGLCVESSHPPAAWGVIRIRTCDLLVTKHELQPLHYPATHTPPCYPACVLCCPGCSHIFVFFFYFQNIPYP